LRVPGRAGIAQEEVYAADSGLVGFSINAGGHLLGRAVIIP
jgi:hypothetical protein